MVRTRKRSCRVSTLFHYCIFFLNMKSINSHTFTHVGKKKKENRHVFFGTNALFYRFTICTVSLSCKYFVDLKNECNREIAAARAMLNQYAGVPLGKIKGFRAPFCKYKHS